MSVRVGDLVQEIDERDPPSTAIVFSVSERLGIVPQSQLFKKQIATDDRSKYRRVQYGDVIYNPYLLWNRAVGVCFDRCGGCVSPAYIVLRPRESGTERFLHYFFRSARLSSAVDAIAAGSVTRRRTAPVVDVLNLAFDLPGLTQQKADNQLLSTLDDKIELNRRMNETLEAMARALFKSWFIDFDPVRAKCRGEACLAPTMPKSITGLFPDSFQDSELGEIPKGWRVGKSRDCCQQVENGGTPSRNVPEYWEPKEVPWLTSGEVRQKIVTATESFISRAGLENSSAKLWPMETTVVALYGATAGQVCLLGAAMCANQACCALIPKPNWRSYVYLHTSASVQAFKQQARGSAQQNVSQQIVADLTTILPNESVVASFDSIVAPIIDRWISGLLESRILAALRDTLLPKLISGDLRVKDVERIVEIV